MNFYVGTSGYSYPKWKGRFYPAKMPGKGMLGFYAARVRAVEINSTFRPPSWFADEVFGLLRDRRAALCVADAEDDLEVPFAATADWGYLRLRRADYDDAALAAWAARMTAQAWRDCFVFFKHEDTGTG